VTKSSAARFLPPNPADLEALRQASQGCHGCPLHEMATQTVFGSGPPRSALMLVGEEPGDKEDRAGVPFVGPAGMLLRSSMESAGLSPEDAYLTNAVKHFKFEQRGKRRLHKKPSAAEVAACAPWLHAELEAVRPRLVVALGATAGQALLGPSLRVTRDRGSVREGPGGVRVLPTVHPSSILRSADGTARASATDRFVADLEAARRLLDG
jgi:uracil-DNA glycosylase family protein